MHDKPSTPRICESCGKPFLARHAVVEKGNGRFCSMACVYASRHNSRRPVTERFWAKVAIGEPDECWMWKAGTSKGYGLFHMDGRKRQASRVAFELTFGEAPATMQVCHTCDTPGCCNPRHLFLGTPHENRMDCSRKGRLPAQNLPGASRRPPI
jgi:hypothetical protein